MASTFPLAELLGASVPMELGLFNAKIHNENDRYIHRLIYQLNELDLLYFVILYRMYRSWLTESFNIVNTPITLLFSKKWVPHLPEDDNNLYTHVQVLI